MTKTEFAESAARAAGKDPIEEAKRYANLPKLEANDIADAVVYVLSTPPHVQVHELTIKPLGTPF